MSEKEPTTTLAKPTAPAEPSNVVTIIGKQVKRFMEAGTLILPGDYAIENALKSAWLALQQTVDMNDKPALTVCTHESIMNALLDMVVQALDVSKTQCYFIVYKNKLVCQRSYFGDQALARRLLPGCEIYSAIIYAKDTFKIGMIRGRTTVAEHTTDLAHQVMDQIRGAYCGVVLPTGEDMGIEVMTLDQIKKSWGMSRTYKPGGASPHNSFPDQMALRTVIRRRMKTIIATSNDELLLASIRRQDLLEAETTTDEDAAQNANAAVLDASSPAAIEQHAETAVLVETPTAEGVDQSPAASNVQPTLKGDEF